MQPATLGATLFHAYVFERQTLAQLARRYGKSTKWVQRHMVAPATAGGHLLAMRICTVIADCTFFERRYGILVFKDAITKECLYYKEITSESPRHYAEARASLAARGIHISAIVLDGRKGVREVFSDIPVQMCQFHQVMIITGYLTRRPKLEAGQELKLIVRTLTKTTEVEFSAALMAWHERWQEFLNERTLSDNKRGWVYTHRRMRSAHRSLMTNLPFLFTHKAHPELSLPNTTNALDGLFSHMKHLLLVHRGISKEKRWKLIQEILKTRKSIN